MTYDTWVEEIRRRLKNNNNSAYGQPYTDPEIDKVFAEGNGWRECFDRGDTTEEIEYAFSMSIDATRRLSAPMIRAGSIPASLALKKLALRRREINRITDNTVIRWVHANSREHRRIAARIERGRAPITFRFEAVDTLSQSGHLWTEGDFMLEGRKMIFLLGGDSVQCAPNMLLQEFMQFVKVVRLCLDNPLVEGEIKYDGVLCEAAPDLSPLGVIARTYVELTKLAKKPEVLRGH